jgi:hypothetical protein
LGLTRVLEGLVERQHLHLLPVFQFLFEVLVFLQESFQLQGSGLPLGLLAGHDLLSEGCQLFILLVF